MADTGAQGTQQQDGQQAGGQQATGTQQGGQGQQQNQPVSFDYDKLAQLINGRTATAEEAALKGYFKQQGLSQQEVEQAIADFKSQKAASTPDAGALQTQLTQAQAEARQAQVQNAATMAAVGLGIDAKTIPYVIKMADLSAVVGTDGKINEETLTNALKKVLEDVPGLKPQANGSGFTQVGASGGTGAQGTSTEDALKRAFGL